MSAVGFFMGRKPRVTYHNLYHAVDVMHATYLTLEGMGASGLLTETEELALLLSALCHDLDHPGLTNSFQVTLSRDIWFKEFGWSAWFAPLVSLAMVN